MSKSEKAILNETLVAVSALPDTIIYRQNSGAAWRGKEFNARIGQTIVVEPGMKILRDAQLVKFGITGGGDAVCASHGLPIQIEVKNEDGRQREGQGRFEGAWTRAGGLYLLVRSAEEAVDLIRQRINNS